jgi:hypothetical protein
MARRVDGERLGVGLEPFSVAASNAHTFMALAAPCLRVVLCSVKQLCVRNEAGWNGLLYHDATYVYLAGSLIKSGVMSSL